jgi:hypothetical protein
MIHFYILQISIDRKGKWKCKLYCVKDILLKLMTQSYKFVQKLPKLIKSKVMKAI